MGEQQVYVDIRNNGQIGFKQSIRLVSLFKTNRLTEGKLDPGKCVIIPVSRSVLTHKITVLICVEVTHFCLYSQRIHVFVINNDELGFKRDNIFTGMRHMLIFRVSVISAPDVKKYLAIPAIP